MGTSVLETVTPDDKLVKQENSNIQNAKSFLIPNTIVGNAYKY